MSKLDQLKALREAKASRKSSDGSTESRTCATVGDRKPIAVLPPAMGDSKRNGSSEGKSISQVGVAPSPSEAKPKKKRAPPGTFDRNAYQRELMRRRRQKEDKK